MMEVCWHILNLVIYSVIRCQSFWCDSIPLPYPHTSPNGIKLPRKTLACTLRVDYAKHPYPCHNSYHSDFALHFFVEKFKFLSQPPPVNTLMVHPH